MNNQTENARDRIIQRINSLVAARDSAMEQSQITIKRVQHFVENTPENVIINPKTFAEMLKSYANDIAGYQTSIERYDSEISCMNWSLNQLEI